MKTIQKNENKVRTFLIIMAVLMFFTMMYIARYSYTIDHWEYQMVYSGDSLWAIADRAGGDDVMTRTVIRLIQDKNELDGTTIHPGQQLLVPVFK